MNALWINRISRYQHSPFVLVSAQNLIRAKVSRQSFLLHKYGNQKIACDIETCATIQEVLLCEARAAKHYWAAFRSLVPPWAEFETRQPRNQDATNRLLDIGYHHLINKVKKILEQHGISPAIGMLHSARKTDSAPLAYDLVELFRADGVDVEVLRFLRLKKKPLQHLSQKHIARFLRAINIRYERKYYLTEFKQCHTYTYYMELQILKFIAAVNHLKVFDPIQLPTRHENRCRRLTGKRYVVTLRLESVP